MKNLKVSLMLFVLVLSPMSLFAAVPWTGAPGTSTVDDASTSLYANDNGGLTFNSTGTGTIVSRLNVTDTTATGYPNWTTMEIRGYDPGVNSSLVVKLVRISSGGTMSTIATCATSDSAMVQTQTCSILNNVDFNSGYIYNVVIELGRTSTSVSPFIHGVRLY
ncbi:MAG TPA: hypothetical protein VF432_33875 [Thermoanaerobaculia bacterium]